MKGSKGGGHSTHDEEEEGEDDWDVKGNKAKKKGYLKKQRQARMHRHEHEGVSCYSLYIFPCFRLLVFTFPPEPSLCLFNRFSSHKHRRMVRRRRRVGTAHSLTCTLPSQRGRATDAHRWRWTIARERTRCRETTATQVRVCTCI